MIKRRSSLRKTVDDKLMYIPDDDKQNYFLSRLKLLVLGLDSANERT